MYAKAITLWGFGLVSLGETLIVIYLLSSAFLLHLLVARPISGGDSPHGCSGAI